MPPKKTGAEKRARTVAARKAKRLKTLGESGGSPNPNENPASGGDGLLAEGDTQEAGEGEGGSQPPPSLPPGGRGVVPPYPPGTPGAEELLERVPPPFGSTCLGCIKSALSGRSEGWCLPGSRGGRKCALCQRNKKSGCAPIPEGRTRELGEKFLRLKRASKETPATPVKRCVRLLRATASWVRVEVKGLV
ncbi:hypothetical protein BDP81DRAFT_121883 [Colletotrichum phormii]|uniref:Uncharacterized protein n=1 Tax=Colletotrichum phormii TaxID=359342 RepID=A0AAI9ZF48_9PEZI|nr:uncharacterized protein BDP81DRAFT_121883 [Colletotrichum phormii]KAK1623408.1 hypothetical protein BDP81DRAFT_121883 [Colletotrichum phormii]